MNTSRAAQAPEHGVPCVCGAWPRTVGSQGACTGRAPERGFSLVEILLVVSLGACLLAGGWSWVWATSSASERAADQAEVRTSLAYARRVLLADLRCAKGLAVGQASTASSMALAVPIWRRADGLANVQWDASRSVLWRTASGCHLAEGVEEFVVTYFDADGCEVDCGGEPLSEALAASVKGVTIEMRICSGGAVATGRWGVWFRQAGG